MFVDLAVLAVLLFGLIHGFIRGALVQVFKLLALVLVWLFGMEAALPLAKWLLSLIRHEGACLVVAYAVITLSALIVFSILGGIINSRIMRTRTLGRLNRGMGTLLGLFKGSIICYLILGALAMIPDKVNRYHLGTLREWRQGSRVYRLAMENSITPKPSMVNVRLYLYEVEKLFEKIANNDPQLKNLEIYQKVRQDPVTGPFLKDDELRRKIKLHISNGHLIQLVEVTDSRGEQVVKRLLKRPDKQLLLWKLIRSMRDLKPTKPPDYHAGGRPKPTGRWNPPNCRRIVS